VASTLELYMLATLNARPQLLGSTILTSSQPSITIPIPAGFNHLDVVWTGRQDFGSGGAFAFVRINNDAGNNYTFQKLYGSGATATSNNGGIQNGIHIGVVPGSGDTVNYFGTGRFLVGNISSSVFKPVSGSFAGMVSVSNGYAGEAGGIWASTAAVTSVSLLPGAGNLVAGSSMSVYGWS
jgi:hypothetical protein